MADARSRARTSGSARRAILVRVGAARHSVRLARNRHALGGWMVHHFTSHVTRGAQARRPLGRAVDGPARDYGAANWTWDRGCRAAARRASVRSARSARTSARRGRLWCERSARSEAASRGTRGWRGGGGAAAARWGVHCGVHGRRAPRTRRPRLAHFARAFALSRSGAPPSAALARARAARRPGRRPPSSRAGAFALTFMLFRCVRSTAPPARGVVAQQHARAARAAAAAAAARAAAAAAGRVVVARDLEDVAPARQGGASGR